MAIRRSLRYGLSAALMAAPAFAFSGLSKDAVRASALITPGQLLGHTRILSSDLFEGRLPATTGDALTQAYVSGQFESLDLQPFSPRGSWLQEFDLVGITSQPSATVEFRHAAQRVGVKTGEGIVLNAPSSKDGPVDIRGAELVFVGYGIVAPEYKWDDYKDVDVQGKILVFLNNEPSVDPGLFAGKTRLYYGRWDYKFEMARKKKALGALILHTTESAGYPWKVIQSSFMGEQFQLPQDAESGLSLTGWIQDGEAQKIVQLSGKTLESLRAAAQKKDFRPIALGTALTARLQNKVRRVKTANVLGVLPGSDAKLKDEYVLYMAHHDHLGVCEADATKRDRICNGALDNASGIAAMLSIARSFSTLAKTEKLKRSILFLATAAEEQGLLGSAYFAKFPPIHPAKISAAINIDGVGIFGKSRDLILIGKGKSNLDALIERFAKDQDRVVREDPFPEQGSFYRSDQFSLAKIGVPSILVEPGLELIGRPQGWGKEQHERWESEHYHQPSDEVRTEWNLSGAVEDIQLLFATGVTLANQSEIAKWNPGDEFELVRMRALTELESLKSKKP